ncbi:hypothetical protein B0H13DRAFT_1707980 [Mycena leptocephala]|nr:hypothetical protein B0H13DRAFT_1707980 [Mycena leptocephala]
MSELHHRAGGRSAKIPPCSITITSPSAVNLGGGAYFLVPLSDGDYTSTVLRQLQVGGKPNNPDQTPSTNQEHVFEIGYINQFFSALANAGGSGQVGTHCAWIAGDVINYVRRDGSTLGAALLAAIDNVQNMVWVDKPMNQAKSNVVNNNKPFPGDPPQSASIVSIINFKDSDEKVYDIETFLRNFAALGSYFGQTSGIFANTAAAFQQLLSEVTPRTIPDNTRSLPVLFRDWLTGILSQYPAGCTSRANNAWNFYRAKMQSVAAATTNGVVPDCFSLYTANTVRRQNPFFNPSSFNFQNLLPPAPATASCNVPGTEGSVGYVGGGQTVRSIPFDITPQRIMGAGNLNFYAVGSGTSLTGAHYQAIDASIIGSQCTNVFAMLNDLPNTQGSLGDANLALQCGGATGKQEVDFNWVFNGQMLGCAALTTGHAGGTTTTILCAASQGAALACAGTRAFTIQMRWFPS